MRPDHDPKPLVLLATSRDWPEGEPGHAALDAALADRGVTGRWVAWDDPGVDWAAADVVAVRSTWDYDARLGEFLDWAAGIGPTLLNGARIIAWNTDKRYLLQLAEAGLPVVPSVAADTADGVRAAVEGFGASVVKPQVGASGRGLEVVAAGEPWCPGPASHPGPWLVQPLVESIRDEGETSVFVIDGEPVSQVEKLPGPDDIRVHEHLGGTSRPVAVTADAAALALEVVAAVVDLIGDPVAYARVDMVRHEGRLVLGEIELTEPGLYLDVTPRNAGPFADAVAARARR